MIRTEEIAGLGRLLALTVRGGRTAREQDEVARLVARAGTERVRAAARANQVEALVGVGLRASGVSPGSQWEEAISANERRVIELVATIAALTTQFERAGVASAAIEAGGVLLATGLPLAGYCPGDIDILVDAARWDTVLATLRAHGFIPTCRFEPWMRRCEVSGSNGTGTDRIEVAAAPFERRSGPLGVNDRSQFWLRRRMPARQRTGLWVLRPADALALVCLHTSLHSYVRSPGLRLHVDVDRLVRDCDMDWDEFLCEVRASRFERRAFVSLTMANELLGSPVPNKVFDQLAPGGPRRKVALACLRGKAVREGSGDLGTLSIALLELLLNDDGALAHARRLLVPPEEWMRARYGASGETPTWRLHARRLGSSLARSAYR